MTKLEAQCRLFMAQQFPKRHGCGQVFNRITWASLPLAEPIVDDVATLEQRHCPCGSTLVVYTAIHRPDVFAQEQGWIKE